MKSKVTSEIRLRSPTMCHGKSKRRKYRIYGKAIFN